PSPTPTWTDTFTPTQTPTWTWTPTWTSTPTWTFTSTPTRTSTATPTSTATSTPTSSPTNTPTPTSTSTATNTATVTPTPPSGIAIGKKVSELQAHSGDTLVYDLALTITGSPAFNVVVTDTLPTHLSFVGFGTTPSGAQTQQIGQILTWSFSSLAVGNYDLYYQAKVDGFLQDGTLLENQAQAVMTGGSPVTTKADVTVFGETLVQIGVYNEAGELVRSILVAKFSQPINSFQLSTASLTS